MEKLAISVQQLSEAMGISLPNAYLLTKRADFPVIRVGTRILIPIEPFKEWLKKAAINHLVEGEYDHE